MLELNKIHVGDCLDHMREMPNESVDLTLTSPPYDNLRSYNGFTFDFENTAKELRRITKPGGVVVWIVADATIKGSETGTSFRQALFFKELGFNIHDTMIWEKPTFTATGALAVRYAQVFEYMFVFSLGRVENFNPIKDRPVKSAGKRYSGTLRKANGRMVPISGQGKLYAELGQRYNVWRMNTVSSNNEQSHPGQFPLALAQDHIRSWSNEDDTVYDPFMGSGTTAIACERLGRRWIGSEISEEYVRLANERIYNERVKLKEAV